MATVIAIFDELVNNFLFGAINVTQILIKNVSGVFTLRNATDSANAGLAAGAITATGIVTTQSGVVINERVITAAGAVTVATTDDLVTVNKTVGAATVVNLPGSPTTGQTFTIHDGKGDAATNNITITPAAGNINGSATLVLNTAYTSAICTYNGTQWDATVILASGGGGTVTSVTGTAPIVSSGGTTPAISITTPIAANYGGTGIASPTAHSLLAANGASAMNLIAPGTLNNFLVSNGTDFAARALGYSDIQALAPPNASFAASPGATITSTTMTAINTSTCRLSITTSHANAKVLIIMTFGARGSGIATYYGFLLDGTSSNALTVITNIGSPTIVGASFAVIITIASAGAHTIDAALYVASTGTSYTQYVTGVAMEIG